MVNGFLSIAVFVIWVNHLPSPEKKNGGGGVERGESGLTSLQPGKCK